jgi:hypothetical protein
MLPSPPKCHIMYKNMCFYTSNYKNENSLESHQGSDVQHRLGIPRSVSRGGAGKTHSALKAHSFQRANGSTGACGPCGPWAHGAHRAHIKMLPGRSLPVQKKTLD